MMTYHHNYLVNSENNVDYPLHPYLPWTHSRRWTMQTRVFYRIALSFFFFFGESTLLGFLLDVHNDKRRRLAVMLVRGPYGRICSCR